MKAFLRFLKARVSEPSTQVAVAGGLEFAKAALPPEYGALVTGVQGTLLAIAAARKG